MMGLMRLSRFFERFDSARDELKKMADRYSGFGIVSGSDFIGRKIYYGEDRFRKKIFGERKGGISVLCGGWCYVPYTLVEDIEFAERHGGLDV